MTKDVNDVHRELGIDGLRERGDSLPGLDFKEPVPKAQGNGLDVAARDDDFSEADKIDLEISRLAKLREVDYEKARNDAPSKLGMRASILDKLVAAERPDSTPGNTGNREHFRCGDVSDH